MRIVIMAIKIRMKRGETFEEAIAHYPKLTKEEIDKIREELK